MQRQTLRWKGRTVARLNKAARGSRSRPSAQGSPKLLRQRDVTATTLHALLELDGELKTKLDLAKLDHAKVSALMKLQVLLLDEVSMLDIEAWTAICSILSTVDHSRRPDVQDSDAFGSLHVMLFGVS